MLLWGDEANVWEASKLIENLLARSQLDEQYIACGLSGSCRPPRSTAHTYAHTPARAHLVPGLLALPS